MDYTSGMHARFGLLLSIVFAARPARAACTYHADYYHPENWAGAVCVADVSVPEGCPIHVVVPQGVPTPAPSVSRSGQPVTVTSTAVVEATVVERVGEKDFESCDCHGTMEMVPFDQVTVTVSGARGGDVVVFSADGSADEVITTIAAPGTCPPPVWPVWFGVVGPCDMCPIPPAEPPRSDAGCSATASGSGLLGLVLAVGVVYRRRRRR